MNRNLLSPVTIKNRVNSSNVLEGMEMEELQRINGGFKCHIPEWCGFPSTTMKGAGSASWVLSHLGCDRERTTSEVDKMMGGREKLTECGEDLVENFFVNCWTPES
ncbi:hypothetical protein Tco_0708993 [Tanacetum coccineum]